MTPIEELLAQADPVLLGATTIGLVVAVLATLLINRNARLDINLDALVFGEPGALGAGVAIIIAASRFGDLSMVGRIVGAGLVLLAIVAYISDEVNL